MLDISLFEKLKRGPQVILPKDASLITGLTGLEAGDKALEVGSGSGFLTVFLASRVSPGGKVVSFEKRPEFLAIARKNVEKTGFTEAVDFREKDAFTGLEEKEVDLVVLDLADSEKLLAEAFACLKEKGFCVGYLPNVEQVKEFVLEGEKQGFKHEGTLEAMGREWMIREKGCRPVSSGVTHTGFLSFLRKSSQVLGKPA